MCTKQPIGVLGNVEGILHVARSMVFRHIQRSKIMPVIFYFGTFGYSETKPFKYFNALVFYNTQRMTCTQRNVNSRKAQVFFLFIAIAGIQQVAIFFVMCFCILLKGI